jgi:hypothetical protein
VDWDELVTTVFGSEGGPRYVRLGLYLVLVAIICIVSVLTMPLITSGEISLRYSDVQEGTSTDALYSPVEAVADRADLVLVGSVLMVIYGIVLILEGRRVINLRQYLVWHAEVRATVLYVGGLLVTIVAVAGACSLFAFSISEPAGGTGGFTVEFDIGSPAGTVSLFFSTIMSLVFLFMVYYNTVLCVYRGGVIGNTRMLARLTLGVALLGLVGLFMLHSMNVMVVEYRYSPDAGGYSFTIPYTLADVDWLAESENDPDFIDVHKALDVLGWSLVVCAVMGLGGCMGVAAYSQRGDSKRVRIAMSLVGLVAVPAIFALGAALSANNTMVQMGGVSLYLSIVTRTATPILAGMGVAVLTLVLGVFYLRLVGFDYVRDAFFEPVEAAPIPQPEVDMELAAAGVPGEAPIGVEPVPTDGAERPPSPLSGLLRCPMPLIAIVVVAIVVIAVVGLGILRGSDDDGGGDGRASVVIEDLPVFDVYMAHSMYMTEGTEERIDVLAEVVPEIGEDSVVFINRVVVTITWTDEPDTGFVIDRWQNQPDTYSLRVHDTTGHTASEDGASNPQGGTGSLSVEWFPGTVWIVYGNQSLIFTGNQPIDVEANIIATVSLDNAGDFESFVGGFTRTDSSNECEIRLQVEGHYYSTEMEGQ